MGLLTLRLFLLYLSHNRQVAHKPETVTARHMWNRLNAVECLGQFGEAARLLIRAAPPKQRVQREVIVGKIREQ